MQFSYTFFQSVFLAVVLCATSAMASPFPASLKHTTLQIREVSPGLVIESFHPESSFEVRTDTSLQDRGHFAHVPR